ncbi:NTP transferase domain-containing protein [Paenibacillus dendritiformis]|nr:sugar phosphate nucleotidyltransferase [Paenibacillus dendritiformis]CAH8771873.1 NTP transferase domain-containing protein [Paenibacillus dendritiformis]
MKGLILCAGKGSRVQPFSSDTPKSLLPVANKPLLFYCIEKLVELNIQEIGIVIQRDHQAMFEARLGHGEQWGITVTYLYQDIPLGIADAVKQAESFIASDRFMLLLGDNLIAQSLSGLRDLVERKGRDAGMLLGRVAYPQDYGIAEVKGDLVIGLEEKPERPKSNLASLGAYVFTPAIFRAIYSISPSPRGEYEITHAIQWLIDHHHSVAYSITDENHSDVGTTERWLEANRWVLEGLESSGQPIREHDYPGCRIIPPVLLDPSCELTDCTIGPYVTIGPRARLIDCHVKNSILLEDVSMEHSELNSVIASRHFIATPSGRWNK